MVTGPESCDLLCAVEADATRRARNDYGLTFHGCAHLATEGEGMIQKRDASQNQHSILVAQSEFVRQYHRREQLVRTRVVSAPHNA